MFKREHSLPVATLLLTFLIVGLAALNPTPVAAASPDSVLQWVGIMNDAVLAGGSSPLLSTRVTALVGASMFDAVNGIHPVYRSLYLRPNAPGYASRRAAAVQAAYVILSSIYPPQAGTLGSKRDASIAAISASEHAKAVDAGIAWGQTVANAILALRSTDGLTPPPPPFVGVLGIETSAAAVGVWRPTPTLNASGAGPQFATMTPWVLTRPSQFRLPPPECRGQCRVRCRLQRDQNDGRLLWFAPLGRSIGTGSLLVWKYASLLEPYRVGHFRQPGLESS
jgi:hypothetical protein